MKTKRVQILYDSLVKYLNFIEVGESPLINDYERRKAIATLDCLCDELMKGEKL